MFKNRIFSLVAVLALVGFVACDAGDDELGDGEFETTTVQPIVEQDTTMAPVVAPVVTEETGVVETTIQGDIDVDRDTIMTP